MTDAELIEETKSYVEKKFTQESTGHDWWHIYRVWRLAKHIAKHEKKVNLLIVELSALLHDIADFKFHGGDLEAGPKAAREWLESLKAKEEVIAAVEDIVRNVSFKGAHVKSDLSSKEGQIVHDADKLDAIGAIGVARVFAYSGAHGRVIHDPAIKPSLHSSFEDYHQAEPTAINHFYEKLLLLKDRMYTSTGKNLAESRHAYMESFLEEFYQEWEGKT